jgi:hypothetical protein
VTCAHRSGLATLGLLLALPGCGAKSAEEIASGMREAASETRAARGVTKSEAENATTEAMCNALEAYTSKPAESLTTYLQREAAVQNIRQQLGLTQVDPDVPQRLIDAADEIDGTQKAGDVLSKLSC